MFSLKALSREQANVSYFLSPAGLLPLYTLEQLLGIACISNPRERNFIGVIDDCSLTLTRGACVYMTPPSLLFSRVQLGDMMSII